MYKKTCNANFQSNYAKIQNKTIEVNDYIKSRILYKNEKIYCLNNHELTLVNGNIIKPHFRHLHDEDMDGNAMSLWHAEWQGNFSIIEKEYNRKNSEQIKNRRADAVLEEYKQIIEFQHSHISKNDVDDRKHDYAIHGMQIIWVIDGNDFISVTKLDYAQRVYLEFHPSIEWKYKSFTEYDSIYIDINKTIYKLNPKNVKSHMIDVELPKEKKLFINALKTGIDLWTNTEPYQCNLYIKQQGAGNGKTFGIVQMLEDDTVSHYKNFIFVVKQHSAKYVIYDEFKNQIEKKQLEYVEIISDTKENNKYIIKFKNQKNSKEYQIIIATIDSLMYSIGNKHHTEFDTFQGIINSIVDEYINTDRSGKIKFAGIDPKLNKETLLIIDEAQDLTKNYASAVLQIMRNKYIDLYVVGDRLQSIFNENNAFTYLSDNDFHSINVNKIPASNICRRFIHPKLVDFVNKMIPFSKTEYNLPNVTPFEEYTGEEYNPLEFFEGKSIYEKENNDENKLNSEVSKIMSYFIKEVEENNRIPEDFLFITPFTKNNNLVQALQVSIEMYWKEKLKDKEDKYMRYSIFHRSEEGSSIDLDESKNSTRLVSIHASKGDGRKVVFIIGISESAFKKFSITTNNLIYDSLFHVSITRVKEKMFIRLENNGDDICQKINQFRFENGCFSIKPDIFIYSKIKYSDIVDRNSNSYFEEFYKNVISIASIDSLQENQDDKQIVDMGNHTIRFSSLLIGVFVEIVNKEMKKNDDTVKQIKKLMHLVSESLVATFDNWRDYNRIIEDNKEANPKIVCILKWSKYGREYSRYYKIIYNNMKNIQKKLIIYLKDSKEILSFCPLECIIFYYMIEIISSGKYASISISDIYNIIDIYNNTFNIDIEGHDNCLCKKQFINKNNDNTINNINKKIKLYLYEHFDKIGNIKNTMNLFHLKYPKVNWLHNHYIEFNGNNIDFIVYKYFQLIGYDESNVYIGYIKPQFNNLNYNEILMNSIYDTYLINNVKKEKSTTKESNYKRFFGKKVITCVFTLDRIEPYYLEWFNDTNDLILSNNKMIKNYIYISLKEKFNIDNSSIYYFYKYWRENIIDTNKVASKFTKFLKHTYNVIKEKNEKDNKKEFPVYIHDFFTKLDGKVEDCLKRKDKEELLIKYDNKDYFMKQLDITLDYSIKSYLGIDEEENNDLEDEEEN